MSMNDEPLEQVERQMAALQFTGAPNELRAAVLADVHRELRAARWDRGLTRAAALLFVAGIALNIAVGMQPTGRANHGQRLANSSPRQSLLDTAVVVAEVTDARTGSRFARQLAEMMGQKLTADEAAAIEAAVQSARQHGANGNKG